MSEETNTGPNGPPDLMRIWLEMASCAAEVGQAGAGAVAPEALRQNRSDLYKVWGDYCEHFLRSAPFLEGQKHAMSGNLSGENRSASNWSDGTMSCSWQLLRTSIG